MNWEPLTEAEEKEIIEQDKLNEQIDRALERKVRDQLHDVHIAASILGLCLLSLAVHNLTEYNLLDSFLLVFSHAIALLVIAVFVAAP